MENLISVIKEYLCNFEYTPMKPLAIDPKIVCSSLIALNGERYEVTIDAKYIYLKDGVPIVANERHDEMTLDGMMKESIEKIVLLLQETEGVKIL